MSGTGTAGVFRVRLLQKQPHRRLPWCVSHEPGLHSARYLVVSAGAERAFCGLDLPKRYRAAAGRLWAGKTEIEVEEVA